jgi:major membrane immunogen (membrane-anchored lipoprotein)
VRLALVVAAALLLGACGERDQVAEGPSKQGKYQGKPDTQSWANAPMAAEWRGGTWKQGDRASWEESIKNRQLAQHEHKRIYQ